jgi:hypothetical protein
MKHITDTEVRLKKLYALLEKIKQHKLGLDWESKLEFEAMEKKIVEEIKSINQTFAKTDVVK